MMTKRKVKSIGWYELLSDEEGNIIKFGQTFTPEMAKLCGTIVTISMNVRCESAYFIVEDNNYWYDWMFEEEDNANKNENENIIPVDNNRENNILELIREPFSTNMLSIGTYLLPADTNCIINGNELIITPAFYYTKKNGQYIHLSSSIDFEKYDTLPSYLFPIMEEETIYKLDKEFKLYKI